MKKTISILLSLVMLMTSITAVSFTAQAAAWNGKAATSFAGGNGSKSKPYLISNAAQLARMRNLVNSDNYKYAVYESAYYKLTANIALNDTSNYSKWSTSAPKNKWTPIGSSGNAFSGHFNGNGYTISGIYISGKADYAALFGRVNGGTVTNLKIAKSYIKGNDNVAALIGYLTDSYDGKTGTVSKCSVSTTTVIGVNDGDSKPFYTGGLIGYAGDKVSVYSSSSSASVSGYYDVGGVVGEISTCEKTSFYSNKNTGKISGGQNVGGVCGGYSASSAVSPKISNNVNSGTVSGERNVGGVFGNIRSYGTAATVSKCYNTGSVTGGSECGGVFGNVSKNNCNVTVSLCYNKGNVKADEYNAGGIAGYVSAYGTGTFTVVNCSNDCQSVSGGRYVGGIVGELDNDDYNSKISNCINKADVTAASDCAGGIAGAIYNSDSDSSTLVTVQNCITTASVISSQSMGTVVGKCYNGYTPNTTNINNNRYLKSAGTICGDTGYSEGAVNLSSNTSAASYQLMDEAYLSNLGFYICVWNIPGDAYPTINLNGSHTYSTTSVTKASAAKKKNGKVNKKCTICANTTSSTLYYPKTVELSLTEYTYTGYVKTPSVRVKNSSGAVMSSSSYKVTYSKGRKNVGKYSVTVKFIGNYTGSITKSFKINPPSTSLSSVSAKSKGFTVKWKKQTAQTTGYQIQYSTNSKFTNAKIVSVSKNSTVSKTVSKLSGKKKYYVRIRTYKNVGNTKYYSYWSDAKSVTTKK